MKNKQEIEKLTEATLNSLNNLQPVEANEFLYAKIKNRMQKSEARERITFNRLMVRLSVALGLFVCLNGASFYLLQKQHPKNNKVAKSGAAAFADEYSLKGDSYSY